MNKQSQKEFDALMKNLDRSTISLLDCYIHQIKVEISDMPSTLVAYGFYEHEALKNLKKAKDSIDELYKAIQEFRNEQAVENCRGKW